jgi:hypothetical protein
VVVSGPVTAEDTPPVEASRARDEIDAASEQWQSGDDRLRVASSLPPMPAPRRPWADQTAQG